MEKEAAGKNKTWLAAATLAPILHLSAGIPWYVTAGVSLLAVGGRKVLAQISHPWILRGIFWAAAAEALVLMKPCWPGQKDMGWVMGILWVLSFLSCRKEKGTLQDADLLLWWLVAFLLGSVLFSAALELKGENLWEGTGRIPLEKAAALLGILILPAALEGEDKKRAIPEAYLTLTPPALSLLTQGVLGIRWAERLAAPFYEMSRSIRLYGIFDRMEALAWLGMMLGTYLYLTLVLEGSIGESPKAYRGKVLGLAFLLGILFVSIGVRTEGFLVLSFMLLGGVGGWIWEKIAQRKKKKEK